MSLLHAFRRRWIPAVAVAIPAALLAAVAAWELIPAPYKSSAVFRVKQYEDKIVGGSAARESDFLNYRDSQIAYVRSRQVLQAALRKPEVAQTETIRALKYPFEYLEEKLIVEPTDSDSFVEIALTGDRPRELKTVVDAVTEAYMNEVVLAEKHKKIAKHASLQALLKQKTEELATAESDIDSLAEALGTGDPKLATDNVQMAQQDLMHYKQALRKAESDLRTEEARRNALLRKGLNPDQIVLPSGTPGVQPGAQSPATYGVARLRALDVLIARHEATVANPENNASLRRWKAERDRLRAEYGDSSGDPNARYSRYDFLKQEVASLKNQVKNAQELQRRNSKNAVELERRSRDIVALEGMCKRLREQVDTLDVEILAETRVTLEQHANIPEVRNVKTRGRLTAIAAVGMFAMVIAGFTLVEWTAQRIAGPAELAAETSLRLLGSMPAPERPGILGKLGFGDPNLAEWNRVLVESVDVVRTYLLRHLDVSRPNAIVICSASANEGKTTLSTQLGSSIARAGRRVVVVDCDFRRPSAHLVFQAEPGAGVSELLRAEADVDGITRETSIPGLFFISAGNVDDASIRTLSMDGGQTLIETLKQHFDFVIVDTSPILFVAEPSMLAQHGDAVVMAVRRDYSRISFVNQACSTLRNLEAPLVGAVMVGAESSIHRQTYGYQQEVRFAAPTEKQA